MISSALRLVARVRIVAHVAAAIAFIGFSFIIAVLVSDWNAGSGLFDYYNKPSSRQRQAIEQRCDRVENAHFDKFGRPKGESEQGDQPGNEEYNLCQQWRTTKAAEKSSDFAAMQGWAAFFGSVLGFCTLVVAIVAARYAYKAARSASSQADAAWKAVEHARVSAEAAVAAANIAELDYRAHLQVLRVECIVPRQNKVFLAGAQVTEDDVVLYGHPSIAVYLVNSGRVPAENVTVEVEVIVSEEHLSMINEMERQRDIMQISFIEPNALVGQNVPPINFNFSNLITIAKLHFHGVWMSKLGVRIHLAISYEDRISRAAKKERRLINLIYQGGLVSGKLERVPYLGQST